SSNAALLITSCPYFQTKWNVDASGTTPVDLGKPYPNAYSRRSRLWIHWCETRWRCQNRIPKDQTFQRWLVSDLHFGTSSSSDRICEILCREHSQNRNCNRSI